MEISLLTENTAASFLLAYATASVMHEHIHFYTKCTFVSSSIVFAYRHLSLNRPFTLTDMYSVVRVVLVIVGLRWWFGED